MPNKIRFLRLALIGAGGMGRRWAWAITQVPALSCRVVVDTDINRAEEVSRKFSDCAVSSDWKKVLRRPDIDAVVIVTPNKWLAPISRYALEHGKHVLCEKPGARNAQEMESVIRAAKKAKRCYVVGFNYRFFQGPALAKKLFERGAIGRLMFIRAVHGFGGRKGYEKEWRFNKAISGGGVLIDQGVHLIDLIQWFLGDVKKVVGLAVRHFWPSAVEDNAYGILQNKKGQVAMLHISWTQWDPIFSFEVYGEKGYIKVEGLGRKYGGSEKVIIGLRNPQLKKLPKERIIVCNPDADQALVRELKEFSSVILHRRQPQPGIQDAYEVLNIAEKVYRQK